MGRHKVFLLILDGWGHSIEIEKNAINNAYKPHWDNIWRTSTSTLINASSSSVGLPNGQMGNSEVGHVNIGSGRVVYQDLTRIDTAIKDQTFFKNVVLTDMVDVTIAKNRALHIMGMLSAGGVHSHEDHIIAMIYLAAQRGVREVYVHAFLDGRDVSPRSARSSLKKIDNLLERLGIGYIATISGRYYAMDRDNRWDRVKKSYDAIVNAKADFYAHTAETALDMMYSHNKSDEFIIPTVIQKHGHKPVTIVNNDSVIFMNFRADRAFQLSYAFSEKNFDKFDRNTFPKINFTTLTKYSEHINAAVAYNPQSLCNTLGEVLHKNHLTQLRIAETEKYAHVTFFLDGGKERQFEGEDRILVPSPHVSTYDLCPEMSAYEVTNNLISAILSDKYDVIICNYANADMVGHTGNYNAAIQAIEVLDECLGRISAAVEKIHGHLFITADHGNADQMFNFKTGKIHTAHTSNPVPFVYKGNKCASVLLNDGKLSDIAPTILSLMGIKRPKEMTGQPIFKFK